MTEFGIDFTGTTTSGRTGLHRIHHASGPLGEALASLPRWTKAMRRWERLNTLRVPVVTGSTEAAVTSAVQQVMDDPDADVDALINAATEAAAREYAMGHVLAAIERVRHDVAADLDAAVIHHSSSLFTALNTQLRECLAVAADVCAALGSVDSAEDAIAADCVDAWRRLPELAAQYKAIRTAQSVLWVYAHGPDRRLHQLALAFMRSPHEVDADFFARRRNTRVETATGSRPANPAPWPEDMTSVEALRWLATHAEAEPWVPTAAQLDAREADLHQLARQDDDDARGSLEVAPSRQSAVGR